MDFWEKGRAFVRYNVFNSWGGLDTIDDAVLDTVEIFSDDVREVYSRR